MDKIFFIGLILGIVFFIVGMFFKGVNLFVLGNLVVILIIIVGIVGVVVIVFFLNEIKRVLKLFGVLFKE